MSLAPPVVHPEPLPRFSTPFRTLFVKEVRRFLSVIVQTVITPLVTAGLYLTIFVGGLGRQLDGLFHGVTYLEYLVPGLAMMGALNQAFFNASSSFMISKFQNNLVDVLVTPLTDLEIASAYGFSSALRGLLVGVLTWAVTLPFGGPWPEHPLLALAILFAGSLAFGFLGVGTGVLADKFDDIARLTTFVILPLTYLGGVFIPIARYPPVARTLSLGNPLLYAIDGLRLAVIGRSGVGLPAVFLVLGAALAITLGFSLLTLARSKAIRG